MKQSNKTRNVHAKNWKVVCDDLTTYHRTRDEARKYAAKLNCHPANANIRQFGPYKNVDGIARVEKMELRK